MSEIMERKVTITAMLRGTENEIVEMVARFAALSTFEAVQSMYIKGEKK